MRHVTLGAISALVVVCLALALVPSGLSATTWLTYREDVAINSGTVDLDYESINQTIDSTHTIDVNISLPCNITNLNQTLTVFRINTSGSNVTFNLTVNGEDVNSSSNVNWTTGNWSNITMAMCIANGVDGNATYISVQADSNSTATAYGRIYVDDGPFTSTWLTNNVVVKEKDVSSPYVGASSSKSFFTVNDSINVSNSIGYALSDVNLTPTFSSQTITAPATYYNLGAIANDSSSETYAQYQKRGPYVFDVDSDVVGTSHEVTIYTQTNELLTSCVDWSLDISDSEYDEAFDDINYDTLEVTLNGNEVEWDEGSVEMEDLTIQTSYSNNEFVFSWTEPVAYVPSTPEAWYMIIFLGMAIYLWLVILIAVVVIVVLVMLVKKNK